MSAVNSILQYKWFRFSAQFFNKGKEGLLLFLNYAKVMATLWTMAELLFVVIHPWTPIFLTKSKDQSQYKARVGKLSNSFSCILSTLEKHTIEARGKRFFYLVAVHFLKINQLLTSCEVWILWAFKIQLRPWYHTIECLLWQAYFPGSLLPFLSLLLFL